MDFNVGGAGHFFEVKTRHRETAQRIQRAALQQFGQGALQRNLKAGMGTKAGKATLVFRIEQGDVHHRVLATQGGVFHQNTKTGVAQGVDASGNAGVAGNHGFWHVGQANAFTDDAAFDVTLENLRQGLRAGLGLGVAGRHAVAHIQITDDVDREIGHHAVAFAHIGNGADAALGVAGVEFHQAAGVDAAFGVVELVQAGVEQINGPATVFGQVKPALLGEMHKVAVRHFGA